MPARLKITANGISLVVLRGEGEATETLLLRRATKVFRGAWCQVAGGIEKGEAAWQTAVRELEEETGLVPVELHSAGICEQFYDARSDGITIAPVFVAFVPMEAEVRLNHEHDAYRWVPLSEAGEYLETPNQWEMFATIDRHFVNRRPSERTRIEF